MQPRTIYRMQIERRHVPALRTVQARLVRKRDVALGIPAINRKWGVIRRQNKNNGARPAVGDFVVFMVVTTTNS